MHPAAVRHDVKNCARCKGDHSLIYFQPFTNPPTNAPYTHWAMCPVRLEPIFFWVVQTFTS